MCPIDPRPQKEGVKVSKPRSSAWATALAEEGWAWHYNWFRKKTNAGRAYFEISRDVTGYLLAQGKNQWRDQDIHRLIEIANAIAPIYGGWKE